MRFLLPKPVRLFLPQNTHAFLTPGTDGCLELHNESSLISLAEETRNSTAGNRCKKTFARMFFGRSEQCMPDAQGRIRIPERLTQAVGLETRLTVVGVGTHWEIWDREVWETYLLDRRNGFDGIAEETFLKTKAGVADALEIGRTANLSKPR